MLKKVIPCIIFISVLLFLALSASPFVRTIDSLLWPIRLGILAGFSILLVWSRRGHRDDKPRDAKFAPTDLPDHFLSKAIRWFRDEQNPPK